MPVSLRALRTIVAAVVLLFVAVQLRAQAPAAPAPTVIVAEGEFFKPAENAKPWKLTPQDLSYAAHTYGGMWTSNGGLLGAPGDSVDAVATSAINVPVAGQYRVWSKYQAPPYFNYMHKIEVLQGGKPVFTHVYGKVDATRFWSFGTAMNKQIWWFWGIDHDAAEAPTELATLAAGPAEIRISTVQQPAPAGDRLVDFIVLTTETKDTYTNFAGHGVGSPFILEAIAATKVYARFKNTTAAPATLKAQTSGHLQPLYGGQNAEFPAKDQPVAPGQWSPWFNIASVCRLAHDDGVRLSLAPGTTFDVQVARDPAGQDLVGDMKVEDGEAVVIPIEIVWNKERKVLTSREHAQKVIAEAKTKWRTSNGGKKPEQIAYYGWFNNSNATPWVAQLKDALGYNTLLPDNYPHIKKDGYFQHAGDAAGIKAFAATLSPEKKANMRMLSFGDEIHLGEINYADPANLTKFRAWLQKKGITKDDLGVDPAAAPFTKEGDPRVVWYSKLFNEEERFAEFAANTKLAEELLNPDVLTAANYSPHGAPQYYGPIYQWVDIFKYKGMKAYWAEDYIFSVPESPQMISWMFATMRCAIKYHDLPIHFYVMPHAPGQTPANLHRSMLFAVGGGAYDIDSFWVAPAENFTENFVDWHHTDSMRVIKESIYDSGEVEHVSVGGKVRPARVAVVLSKATDFNEPKVQVDPKSDPFAAQCTNFPQGGWQQTLCRKDQQALYLALRNAQHGVDLITEDDIVEGVKGKDILAGYDVIYFSGEWVEVHAAKKLDAWVKNGGVLYASGGLGHLNQYNQPEASLLGTLGLKSVTIAKNAYHLRPLLELPLAPVIDTITLDAGALANALPVTQVLTPESAKISAIGMKQVLTVDAASGAKVVGKWADGSAAVTVRDYGKGKAIAVGTLPGQSYFKTGTKVQPWARGGFKMVYAPVDFDPAATNLALMGVRAKPGLAREAVASDQKIEIQVLDNAKGTLVTLVNWAAQPSKGAKITVKLPFKPSSAKLISAGKAIPVTYENNEVSFSLDVNEAEYVLLNK